MSTEFDFDGFLYKRAGSSKKKKLSSKKFHYYYINLIGGSLHYYEDIEEDKPKGTVELGGMTLIKKVEDAGREFTFSLHNETNDFLFAAEDEAELNQWLEHIEANLSKPSAPYLNKEKKKGRVAIWAQKAKKNVGGKIATSSLGKKALKSKAPEEVINLIKAVRAIVEKQSHTTKKAAEVEKNLFKIGVKSFFIVDSGKLKFEDFLEADKPLRKGLELLGKCYDHAKFSRHVREEALKEKLVEVEKSIREAADVLKRLLEPHIQAKNLGRIDATLNELGTADFLFKILLDKELEEEVQELINASEHYTQFHFYAN